jgi:hypothetical protein
VDLRLMLERLTDGGRLTETEKDEIARVFLETPGRDQAIKLLTRNQSYGRVLEIADDWSERFQADRRTFLKAWRGETLEDEEPAP